MEFCSDGYGSFGYVSWDCGFGFCSVYGGCVLCLSGVVVCDVGRMVGEWNCSGWVVNDDN